jgi:hypothetical protein
MNPENGILAGVTSPRQSDKNHFSSFYLLPMQAIAGEEPTKDDDYRNFRPRSLHRGEWSL